MNTIDTSITVLREGNFTSSENHILDEIDFYQGHENSIMMNQTYTKNFHCFYRFEFFPFDTQVLTQALLILPLSIIKSIQVCSIDLVVKEFDKEIVHLVPGDIVLDTSKELTQHFLTSDPESPTLDYQVLGTVENH